METTNVACSPCSVRAMQLCSLFFRFYIKACIAHTHTLTHTQEEEKEEEKEEEEVRGGACRAALGLRFMQPDTFYQLIGQIVLYTRYYNGNMCALLYCTRRLLGVCILCIYIIYIYIIKHIFIC